MEDFKARAGGPAPQGAPDFRPGAWRAAVWSAGRRIEQVLFAFGFAALAAAGAVLVEASIYQRIQGLVLEGERRGPRAAAGSAQAGDSRLVGRIEVPRIGLSAIIREGIDRHTLLIAVGHVPGTALPGEDGNVVVSGHRDTFFRPLRRVRVSDPIRIVTPEGVYHYRVSETLVAAPDRTEVLRPTDEPTLTLITCYPFSYIGPAPKRFIVRALQTDSPGQSLG